VGGHQVAARGSYVPPVGARDVRPQAPRRLELGEDLALYGDLLAARDHLQDLGLEHVDAGVHQVGGHLVGGRLLDESVHEHVVVDLDEAVGRRVLDAGQGYRGEGVGLPVPVDEPLEVHAREHVAVYRHYRPPALQVARGVLDATRRTESPALDRVVHGETVEVEVGQVLLDRGRQITQREHGPVEPAAPQEVQHVPHERPVPQRDQGLGDVVGNRPQPGAQPSNKNNGLHRSRSLQQPPDSG
jgi:hypothetical protein